LRNGNIGDIRQRIFTGRALYACFSNKVQQFFISARRISLTVGEI
jgi:hypothetical protein